MAAGDLLLDTHVLIWMAIDPDRIPVGLLKSVEQATSRLVSHVTALEIQIKHSKNPASFHFSLRELEQTMRTFACTETPITYRDIAALSEMRFQHSDPFDRLLMAQAANRDVLLATLDERIISTAKQENSFAVWTE